MKNSLRKVHRRASTSGMGTARRRLIDRGAGRGVPWGNPQHLSAYKMDMLDVSRHICASTWVIMVTIAPRGLGQGDDARRR